MSNKLSDHQLCLMFKGISGNRDFSGCRDEDEILEVLYNCDNFKASFFHSDTYVIRDRYPIYVEFSRANKSALVDTMKESMDYTALVSDSIRSGKDGLFFLLATEDESSVHDWMCSLSKKNMYCCEFENTYYIASPVVSFFHT